MGSPLVPVLANFFIDCYKKLWLEKYIATQVYYYRRYFNDICRFEKFL